MDSIQRPIVPFSMLSLGRAGTRTARPFKNQAIFHRIDDGGDPFVKVRKALFFKAVISGMIISVTLEVARRSPNLGGLILSLPLISVLTFLLLWRDTGDIERIAQLATSVFWFFLPTLPMFLIFPALLRGGMGFWLALSLALGVTAGLYVSLLWFASRVGIQL